MRDAGYELGNVAVQVIGERPRLGGRRAAAEAALSGGSTTGRPADLPSQPWSGDTGGAADPEASYGSESGQDTGSMA